MVREVFQGDVPLVKKQQVAKGIFHFVFYAPEVAVAAKPGQFLMLRPGPTWEPLLRRPLSLYQVNREEGTVEVVFRVVGRGTSLLSQREEGEAVDLMGPLGQGFFVDEVEAPARGGSHPLAVLVGGGLGAAPLPFLAQELRRRKRRRMRAFLGARCRDEVIGFLELIRLGVEVTVATEDGSLGEQGRVTQILHRGLQEGGRGQEIYACGPWPMLEAIAPLAREFGCGYQVSLEARMACGVGACLGCTCREVLVSLRQIAGGALGEGPAVAGTRVCVDGPVFRIREKEGSNDGQQSL